MKFENRQELERIAALLEEADFERADGHWEPGGAVFTLKTSRPLPGTQKKVGLFRKPREDWVRCRLTIRQVKAVSVWEEYDVKPPIQRFLTVEPSDAAEPLDAVESFGAVEPPGVAGPAGVTVPSDFGRSSDAGFTIRLASAHGLRVDLVVTRLEGTLEDEAP